MSIYLALPRGIKVFVEIARWASQTPGFALRRENGEILVWLGRLHLIYTPARWSPVSGETFNGKQHPI